MTREVGVRRVYVGLRRARERGNVPVFKLQGDRGRLFVSVCFGVFALYLFVNAHGDTPDPLWKGLCYSAKELC